MILFQAQIEEHQKLAEHYRELAAQREALAAGLLAFQQQADSDLSSLRLLVDKCKEVAPSAIASLKTAVLNLFSDSDSSDNGGNQPTEPTPEPDDDEPELLCLNGETGECLTTADLDSVGANAVPCAICGADLNDETNYPEYTAAALAGICRSCEESAIEAEKAAQAEDDADSEINTGTPLTYAQAIKNRCSACWGYEVKSKADIKAGFINRTDLNFMEAVNLERTGREFYETVEDYLNKLYYNGQACEWASPFASPFACPIEPIPQPQKSSTEMIHTSARTGYLKLKESGQILAAYAWFPRKDLAEAWFDWLDGMSLGLPELRLSQRNSSWKYEIKLTGLSMTQIERLSQEDLSRKPSKKKETPAQAAGIEPPSGWRQPQQPEVQVTAEAPKKARIILESSPYNGHVCDVVEVSHDWWTLATPKGNLKYPADSVESVDDAVQMAQNRQEAEAYEFNDIVQVCSDGNDCVGLVGNFGRVKVVKSDRIGVEIDEQLVYFKSSELKLKVKAEIPSQQQNHPPSADVSISDQEATYLQTNGNYRGIAKQTRQRWEQAGINPSDLIADMKAKRPAEPAWDAERYNPVLAGVGADDASDF